MSMSALKRFGLAALVVGLVSAAFAAKAPADRSDLMNFLGPLWGKSATEFAKAAKLGADDQSIVNSPAGAERRVLVLSERVRARWTPKSLAANLRAVEFDAKLGLVEAVGTLTGTAADFEALVKEMNARYGQYATRTTALEVNTYGWVFPKATLSLSSKEGVPSEFRVQANP